MIKTNIICCMPPIGQPPKDIYDCGLLKSLDSKTNKEDGAYSLVSDFIKVTIPLLDTVVSGPFEHYTLHNRDHAKKLLHLADSLLPTKIIEQLSTVEHIVLIYAAHLHDLGLSLSFHERQSLIKKESFLASLRSWSELQSSLEDARVRYQATDSDEDKLAIEEEIFQIHEGALSNYLRPLHATPERYREIVSMLKHASGRDDLFSYRGVSFEDWLIDICVSHNLSPNVLAEARGPYDEQYPRDILIAGERLNAQFCAVVLRLTDVLDFDRERTPKILFESLGISYRTIPGADVSLREWQKHMSIHTLSIDPDEIVVAADCHHPVIEKTIRDFCQIIEREIRDSLAVLRRSDRETASRYYIELPISVRPKIRPIGYVYRDMSLQLNQAAIAGLLMGDRLYSNREAAIRELLQNAIDACHARRQLEGAHFMPLITVTDFIDDSNRHWIEVTDNGIGMDERVLAEYFLTLGNSYYDTPDFKRLIASKLKGTESFTPIARFGIGIASVFMLADLLEVHTRSFHSLYNDNTSRVVRLERMGTLAFVTESNEGPSGTSIRIRLKRDLNSDYEKFASSVAEYLKRIVIRPQYDIDVRVASDHFILHDKKLLPRNNISDAQDLSLELVSIDLNQYSELLSGEVFIFLYRMKNGQLSHKNQNRKELRLGQAGLEPSRFVQGYIGNTISVNGFRMSFRKMAKLLGFGKSRIALILDVNVLGQRGIEYDVGRDRIVGNGKFRVAVEFRHALLQGLRGQAILDRLDPETKGLINKVLAVSKVDYVLAKGYLKVEESAVREAVEELGRQRLWGPDIASRIADFLHVPLDIVNGVLDKMLAAGFVPRQKEDFAMSKGNKEIK